MYKALPFFSPLAGITAGAASTLKKKKKGHKTVMRGNKH
jgi:hypothetical protein